MSQAIEYALSLVSHALESRNLASNHRQPTTPHSPTPRRLHSWRDLGAILTRSDILESTGHFHKVRNHNAGRTLRFSAAKRHPTPGRTRRPFDFGYRWPLTLRSSSCENRVPPPIEASSATVCASFQSVDDDSFPRLGCLNITFLRHRSTENTHRVMRAQDRQDCAPPVQYPTRYKGF